MTEQPGQSAGEQPVDVRRVMQRADGYLDLKLWERARRELDKVPAERRKTLLYVQLLLRLSFGEEDWKSASKWAVRGMTKVAALELGKFDIRVNSIHPGLIDTDMMRELPWLQAGKLDRVLKTIPLGRPASSDEVAQLALFLATDESSYCTGGEFIVDGGIHC